MSLVFGVTLCSGGGTVFLEMPFKYLAVHLPSESSVFKFTAAALVPRLSIHTIDCPFAYLEPSDFLSYIRVPRCLNLSTDYVCMHNFLSYNLIHR